MSPSALSSAILVEKERRKHRKLLDSESLKTIFQPFASKKKGGTGLGLAIVKKIVDAHGGEISFRSNPERGVTFSAAFPEG